MPYYFGDSTSAPMFDGKKFGKQYPASKMRFMNATNAINVTPKGQALAAEVCEVSGKYVDSATGRIGKDAYLNINVPCGTDYTDKLQKQNDQSTASIKEAAAQAAGNECEIKDFLRIDNYNNGMRMQLALTPETLVFDMTEPGLTYQKFSEASGLERLEMGVPGQTMNDIYTQGLEIAPVQDILSKASFVTCKSEGLAWLKDDKHGSLKIKVTKLYFWGAGAFEKPVYKQGDGVGLPNATTVTSAMLETFTSDVAGALVNTDEPKGPRNPITMELNGAETIYGQEAEEDDDDVPNAVFTIGDFLEKNCHLCDRDVNISSQDRTYTIKVRPSVSSPVAVLVKDAQVSVYINGPRPDADKKDESVVIKITSEEVAEKPYVRAMEAAYEAVGRHFLLSMAGGNKGHKLRFFVKACEDAEQRVFDIVQNLSSLHTPDTWNDYYTQVKTRATGSSTKTAIEENPPTTDAKRLMQTFQAATQNDCALWALSYVPDEAEHNPANKTLEDLAKEFLWFEKPQSTFVQTWAYLRCWSSLIATYLDTLVDMPKQRVKKYTPVTKLNQKGTHYNMSVLVEAKPVPNVHRKPQLMAESVNDGNPTIDWSNSDGLYGSATLLLAFGTTMQLVPNTSKVSSKIRKDCTRAKVATDLFGKPEPELKLLQSKFYALAASIQGAGSSNKRQKTNDSDDDM